MKGIPTTYNGRNYRSRLEARWAALFDQLNWRYEYEPYDLPGWIPDFIILGNDEILIEVKPFTQLEEFDTKKIFAAMEKGNKADKEVLLLGCCPFVSKDFSNESAIGWLSEGTPDAFIASGDFSNQTDCRGFNEAFLTYDGKWGFRDAYSSYHNRIAPSNWGGHPPNVDFSNVQPLWNEAANSVQWRSGR